MSTPQTATKRRLDDFMNGQQDCRLGSPAGGFSRFKRQRSAAFNMTQNASQSLFSSPSSGRTSPFQPPIVDIDSLIERPRKKCRQKRREGNVLDCADDILDSERTYKLDEVKRIVDSAIQKYQVIIKEEYEKLLTQQLQEQFSTFTRFNQDYISRQMKRSDFSYLS